MVLRYITSDTLIVLETSLDTPVDYAPEMGFSVVREKTYKTNKHVFLRRV